MAPDDSDDITITVTSLGTSDARLALPPSASTSDVRSAVSAALRFHPQRLTLILQRTGAPLVGGEGDASPAGLVDGDTLLAVEAPRPPPARVRAAAATTTSAKPSTAAANAAEDDDSDDDDDDAYLFRVRIDSSTRPAAAAVARTLLAVGAPESFVAVATHPRVVRALAWTVAWALAAKAASRAGVGPLFICASLVGGVYANLGRRRPGDASAYAIFNDGFRELLGTYNAGAVDRGLRRGNL